MPPLPIQSGPNMAQLDSMNQANKNSGSGSGLPAAGGSGMNSTVGGQIGQSFQQQSNLNNNFASVGGINPIPFKPAFTNDIMSSLFDGNMSPGQIEYAQFFAANNIGFGDVSASSAFGLQKNLHLKEGGHSFANIGDIKSR